MHHYPFHIGDFRSGTVNMSRVARWIYRDMLDVYYDTEKPLTLDFEKLCDEIGVDSEEEQAIVKKHLRFKFVETEQGYVNVVCDAVIAEYKTKAENARRNGSLGGRPPKSKQSGSDIGSEQKPSRFPAGSEVVSEVIQHETKSQTNHKPITNNHEPYSVTDVTGAAAPTARDIVFANGVPLLTVAGVSEKNARSMLAGLCKANGDEAVARAIEECAKSNPVQPVSWLQAILKGRGTQGIPNKQEAQEARNKAAADAWLQQEGFSA